MGVCILSAGAMGSAIAQNLLGKGFEPNIDFLNDDC
jgi:3-hydroxyisobutyrate dehydrogenase-like beta-hydroxyacid dehydrogenase